MRRSPPIRIMAHEHDGARDKPEAGGDIHRTLQRTNETQRGELPKTLAGAGLTACKA